jgi:hypothetical protein
MQGVFFDGRIKGLNGFFVAAMAGKMTAFFIPIMVAVA